MNSSNDITDTSEYDRVREELRVEIKQAERYVKQLNSELHGLKYCLNQNNLKNVSNEEICKIIQELKGRIPQNSWRYSVIPLYILLEIL